MLDRLRQFIADVVAPADSARTFDETDYRVLEFWFHDDSQALKVTLVGGQAVKYTLTDNGLLGPRRVPPKD